MGVINKAQSQGQLKPGIFNMKITKAITKMAQNQADKENHPRNLNSSSNVREQINWDKKTTISGGKAVNNKTKQNFVPEKKQLKKKDQHQNTEKDISEVPKQGPPPKNVSKTKEPIVMKPQRERSASLSNSKPKVATTRRQSLEGITCVPLSFLNIAKNL